jgi:hypothetical protein
MTLGTGPSCKAMIGEPNADAGGGWSPVSWQGTTRSLALTFTAGTGNEVACFTGSGTLSSPYQYQRMSAGGVWLGAGYLPLSTSNGTFCGLGGTAATIVTTPTGLSQGQGSTGQLRVIDTSQSNAVVASNSYSSGDPLRNSTCTLTWPGGSTTTGFVGQYRESEGFPVGAVSAACTEAYVSKPGHGPNLFPTGIKVGSTNTETGAQTEIADQEIPEYTEAERKGLDPGDGTGLKLWKIVTGVKTSCMTWAADCSNWWSDTDSGTSESTGTGKYRCEFGGKKVDLAECGVYRRTFDDTETTTITDPETGEDREWFTEADGRGSTDPGAGLDPSGECFAQGWASVANPIEWVLVPIKCALVWAFVPRTRVIEDAVQGIGDAAGDVQLVDPLMTLLAELPTSSGCDGIPLELTFFGQDWEGRLLEACSGEAAAAATVVNGLMTLALVTGAVLAIARYAAAVFGFIGPGGSIEQAQRGAEVQQRQSGKAGS